MSSVRKTLKTLVWSVQNRSISCKICPENNHKIRRLFTDCFPAKVAQKIPAKSADFSAILSLKIPRNLTFFSANYQKPCLNTSIEQHWFINTHQGFYKPSSISPLNTSLPHPTHSVSLGMVSHKCNNYSEIKDVFRSLAGHHQSTLCFAWSIPIFNGMEWLWWPLDSFVIHIMVLKLHDLQ